MFHYIIKFVLTNQLLKSLHLLMESVDVALLVQWSDQMNQTVFFFFFFFFFFVSWVVWSPGLHQVMGSLRTGPVRLHLWCEMLTWMHRCWRLKQARGWSWSWTFSVEAAMMCAAFRGRWQLCNCRWCWVVFDLVTPSCIKENQATVIVWSLSARPSVLSHRHSGTIECWSRAVGHAESSDCRLF